jgi:hypothetical protein
VEDVAAVQWTPVMGRQGLGRSKPRKNKAMFAGVETGHCGVWDNARYCDDESTGAFDDAATFYGTACNTPNGLVRWQAADAAADDDDDDDDEGGDDSPLGVCLKTTGDGQLNMYVARDASGDVVAVRLGDSDASDV